MSTDRYKLPPCSDKNSSLLRPLHNAGLTKRNTELLIISASRKLAYGDLEERSICVSDDKAYSNFM